MTSAYPDNIVSDNFPIIVKVPLGSRSYDIVIGPGLLVDLGHWLDPVIGDGKVHIVTDETVFDLYKSRLYALERAISVTVLPVGEAQKSFETLQQVLDDMFEQGLDRNDTLLAFGGGVIGDLTGFAASVYKRGCQFVQVPTTLLAQVDSSVGGKTAINVPAGKNLVGAFYQPKIVIADVDVLSTLPDRELKAGYAEVLKYGLLGDIEFFNWLEDQGENVLALNSEALSQAVATSCRTKANIVAADERERGQRALLNLGHTFGHALEAEAGYGSDLLHGEAVSAGMAMAFEFSVRQGLCDENASDQIKTHLSKTGLTSISDVSQWLRDPDRLLKHMMQDKKNEGGALTLILARAIGDAFIDKGVDQTEVKTYLAHLAKTYA